MASIIADKSNLGDTKAKILDLLLGGAKSAGSIAETLHIQKSAARVHLESLKSSGAVKSKFQMEKMGRPKKVYELTEKGREFFPRQYDLFLNLMLDKIAVKKGEAEARKLVESIAEDIASGIRSKIDAGNADSLEKKLQIINDASNEIGFASSISKDSADKSAYCIESRNCVLHKVASHSQDTICHGLHDKIIAKSLDGHPGARVELKKCMALGYEYCTHVIRSQPRL